MEPSIKELLLGRRFQLWVLSVVAVLALVAANVAWLLPTLGELETSAYFFHRAIALDVRNQISAFLDGHQRALINAADIISRDRENEREIISRLMKENQPIESLGLIGVDGKEIFKSHRFLLLTPADFKDRSAEDLFKNARQGRIFISDVTISGISEPIVTIAVPINEAAGFSALVADINLKFLLDVVRAVRVGLPTPAGGGGGAAYVVDSDGFIIAHPDSSLVFGRTNLIGRKLIREALTGKEVDTRNREFEYSNAVGEKIFAVALPFGTLGWAIAVENLKSDALAASRRISNVAIVSFVLELLLLTLLIWNYFKLVKTANLFYSERNQREAILNSLYDGVVEYDEKSQIVLMNPKAEELLGIKFRELAGLFITPELAKNNPKLRGIVELMYPALAPYASATKELPGSLAKTMEVHVSNPELRLMVTLTQVIDSKGNVKGFLKILRDISREQLISRIKSEFVSIAAHQLRTPLSAIKWTLKLLIDGDAGEMTASQQEFLEKGYTINERMIKLVNDLLSAARIEEGRFGYEFKDVDLGGFLNGIIANYMPLARARGLFLKLERLPEKLPMIYADPEKLSLAVGNLLDNAIKYTLKGGGVIVKIATKGGFAETSIADTGVGIPKEEQKRVFSKFFRASNVLRMETEGTGLGLFIVRNIIKRHGGNIRFESQQGKGTTFSFSLPLAKELVPKEETPVLEEFLETI